MAFKSSCKSKYKHNPPGPNWLELPEELLVDILHRVGVVYILENMQLVCKTWYNTCKNPYLWRSVYFPDSYRLNWLCQQAVSRSCGQLNDISLECCYSTDGSLNYIVNRAPQLRSLRLLSFSDHSVKELSKIATKLPNLEKLHIFFTRVPTEVLEQFGLCCPQLKSLTYDYRKYQYLYSKKDPDGVAMAIARTMPRLHHLSLIGNKITNHGLQAILDRCSHLESLDLSLCPNVKQEEAFWNTCAQRIKNLKYTPKSPNDPIELEGSESDDDYMTFPYVDIYDGDLCMSNDYYRLW